MKDELTFQLKVSDQFFSGKVEHEQGVEPYSSGRGALCGRQHVGQNSGEQVEGTAVHCGELTQKRLL